MEKCETDGFRIEPDQDMYEKQKEFKQLIDHRGVGFRCRDKGGLVDSPGPMFELFKSHPWIKLFDEQLLMSCHGLFWGNNSTIAETFRNFFRSFTSYSKLPFRKWGVPKCFEQFRYCRIFTLRLVRIHKYNSAYVRFRNRLC